MIGQQKTNRIRYHQIEVKSLQSCPDSLRPLGPPGSSIHGIFPGKNTGVGCHFLLQEIFPTQGWNPGLPHCGQMLYCLVYVSCSLQRFDFMRIHFFSCLKEPFFVAPFTHLLKSFCYFENSVTEGAGVLKE